MSTTLFYHPEAALDRVVEFDPAEATHIGKSLRMRSGERVQLTNGRGDLFNAELVFDKHRVSARSIEVLPSSDAFVPLHLGIAPTKNADRMEWLVEKAVEIGVGKISLITCAHSERPRLSIDRLQRIAISALKQSRRTFLPTIVEAVPFEKWLAQVDSSQRFIAHCDESQPRRLLRDTLKVGDSVCVAIGPEGDFSAHEVGLASAASFAGVSLGSARLRTETAALAAVHTFNLLNQSSHL
jgi:16S rRNA (uracil1498-N3)-methyltransferase